MQLNAHDTALFSARWTFLWLSKYSNLELNWLMYLRVAADLRYRSSSKSVHGLLIRKNEKAGLEPEDTIE